jgi:tRNA threonylcarbamoyladenosine biosynthesis protein TsaB
MLTLTIRTDNPEAEVGLFDNDAKLDYQTWQAHRELSVTLHRKVADMLKNQGKELKDVQGIVCFEGPGSFTGLRIGLTVANALAYGLHIPIVATRDEDWIQVGLNRIKSGDDDRIALPHYGAPVHITAPRK